ncbi:D-glucuronyl C5-epimerase B-like [Oppia nitens]|uniref:D-glucuronyl C5-epimerase B-like n=1 Tax=Oppia nitens TaxID=1686743 RepID=UPI0023D99756|nr:D-glucuronyl C5-epimerase B-like [Oppia nitens]
MVNKISRHHLWPEVGPTVWTTTRRTMKFHRKCLLVLIGATISIVTIFTWFTYTRHTPTYRRLLLSRNTNWPTTTRPLPLAAADNNNDNRLVDYTDVAANSHRNHHQQHYKRFQAIDCIINNEYDLKCIRSIDGGGGGGGGDDHKDTEVYIPFAFIHKYFEIDGKLTKDKTNGKDVFEWSHSYSKVYLPKTRYDPSGQFLWFDNYNVEVRDRVRCVSARTGVPISTQWLSSGHYYPIQIAQFGLSHWSRLLVAADDTVDGGKQQPPQTLDLDSGIAFNRKAVNYLIPRTAVFKRIVAEEDPNRKVLLIDGQNIVMKLKQKSQTTNNNLLILAFDVKPLANFSLKAILRVNISNQLKDYSLIYTTTIDDDIMVSSNEIFYAINNNKNNNNSNQSRSGQWSSLTRDIGIDLQKGQNMADKRSAAAAVKGIKHLRLIRLEMSGSALLANIRLMSSAHELMAITAGNWFLANQQPNGGFSIKVNRKLSNGALQLKTGWYSAMAQGQAISLLVRLYKHTGQDRYLNCAKQALNLFDVDVRDNGFRTRFLGDKYLWFEEYPTVPSIYVLNGFIYSLFGLYDLSSVTAANDTYGQKAGRLYRQGIQSLQSMLPMYDTGSGSLYDLRHLALGSPPNRARWDYHSTHINQLLFLNTIENNPLFQSTAKRWISYMKGYRAPHN